MKTRKVDYHIHSSLSDGDLSPSEIAVLCSHLKVDAFAITDHDSIGSVHKLKTIASFQNAQLVSGVELDCLYKNREVHLLGYDFDENDANLNAHLKITQDLRLKRIIEQIHKINNYYHREVITEGDIINGEKETLMKPHIIHKLIAIGFHNDLPFEPAYQTINKLLTDLGTDTELLKIDIVDAIKLIKNAGGLRILAHPGYYHTKGIAIDVMFKELKCAGLDGIEVNYPYNYNSPDVFSLQFEYEIINTIESLSNEYRYLKTSGSDAHTRKQLIDNNNHGL